MSKRPFLPLALAVALLCCSGVAGNRTQHRASGSGSGGVGAAGSSGTTAASQESCSFVDTYRLAWSGGMTAFRDRYTLEPPDRFTKVRDSFVGGGSARSCEGRLPACESAEELTVRAVSALLTDPVVLEAWPDSGDRIVGRDLRPVDASLMVVSRESGGSLLIGEDCREAAGCTTVPPAVATLRETLRRLARQISSTEAGRRPSYGARKADPMAPSRTRRTG